MMLNSRSICCGLLALLVLVASRPAAAAPPAGQPIHSPFVTVVLDDFDAWDLNHDGELSIDEINQLTRTPSVKGDAAAAVAAIKLLAQGKVPLPALTKDYFLDYDRKAMALGRRKAPATQPAGDAITATVDTVASGATTRPAQRSSRLAVDFDLYFAASRARIARGGANRFTGRYVLDHTRQGPLGDCFFVGGVGSLLVHDPSRLEKLITPSADGSGYLVHLAATQPVVVPAPTDAELAISSTTAGDGIWLAVLEQAMGKYRSTLKGGSDDVEGTDIIRSGGDSGQTIRALTGHKTLRLVFGRTVGYRRQNADRMLPELRKQLGAAIAGGRIITAGVLPPFKPTDNTAPTTAPAASVSGDRTTAPVVAPVTRVAGEPTPIPPDINVNHVYAVLSYDPATDIVEIWNPHGQRFTPTGPPGITNGYPTLHGRFKLPLTEAYQFFTSFTFELPEPMQTQAR